MILKIFSFIFLLIFNLYKNIVDTAVQFHGLLFFNHLNIAHILLYHSRSSLARKVQRENKVSGVLILNYIPIMNLKKKTHQWVGRPSTMIHWYHKIFQISFVLMSCKSTIADKGRKDWFCTSDYTAAGGLQDWIGKTSSQRPYPSPGPHQLAKLCAVVQYSSIFLPGGWAFVHAFAIQVM